MTQRYAAQSPGQVLANTLTPATRLEGLQWRRVLAE
jgi:hypothetical protein